MEKTKKKAKIKDLYAENKNNMNILIKKLQKEWDEKHKRRNVYGLVIENYISNSNEDTKVEEVAKPAKKSWFRFY